MSISFNEPHFTKASYEYMAQCMDSGVLQGDGPFTRRASKAIEDAMTVQKVLLTPSCTDALEMSAILAGLQPGDEVIMPSYTFTSTANAYVLRGAVPVFVDIRRDTINIDEHAIEAAITPRTRAIVVVHYGGVACAMEPIMTLAQKHNLLVIEDAAHAYGASYKGKALGSIAPLATYSFHNTKNISSGEGGALLINDHRYDLPAEILREKGTNRSSFMRGDVAFYAWQDMGSSFLMSDLTAALLLGQIEAANEINTKRLKIWARYHAGLAQLEAQDVLTRPTVPNGCDHNAHLYYFLARDGVLKSKIQAAARAADIGIISHYVPLHSAPAGLKYGRAAGALPETQYVFDRLLRLPMHANLTDEQVDTVIDFLKQETK